MYHPRRGPLRRRLLRTNRRRRRRIRLAVTRRRFFAFKADSTTDQPEALAPEDPYSASPAKKKVHVAEPWDLLRGRDVFALHDMLSHELAVSDIGHWAPNCSTFSRARELPIPGVKSPPKPLRSSLYPRSLPEVVSKLPKVKKRKLDLDTRMADMAAEDCILRAKSNRFFSLEHPKNSIARDLNTWRELESLPGTIFTEYHTCMFEGSKRRKQQVLIHNIPQLVPLIGRKCPQPNICQRTGEKHLCWRPRVEGGRVQRRLPGRPEFWIATRSWR